MRVEVVRPGGVAGEGFATEVDAAMGLGSGVLWADGGLDIEEMSTGVEIAIAEVVEVVVFVAIVEESWKLLTGITMVVMALEDNDIVIVALVEGEGSDCAMISLCNFNLHHSIYLLGLKKTRSKPSMSLQD